MAHFAKVNENNIVESVVVVNDENENNGNEFLNSIGFEGNWIKTSYNTLANKHLLGGIPLRKNFAGIGYTYNIELDAFIPPKPYPSWSLDENTCQWNPPVSSPNDGKSYIWNEDTLSWVEVNV